MSRTSLAEHRRRSLLALLAAITMAGAAFAIEPDEVLKDPALEMRARHISAELRCPVCQNQSIDDSNAPLARDLRVLVRERLVAGDSDADVKRFLVERYGDFVLLRPPFSVATLLLWLTPALVLLIVGALIVRAWAAPSAGASESPLSEDERRKLAQLLGTEASAAGKK